MERQLLKCRGRVLLAALLLGLAGCATQGPQPAGDVAAPAAAAAPPAPPQPPRDLWERMRRQLRWQAIDNPRVRAARRYYLEQPGFIDAVTPRAQRYLHYLVTEVERRQLPLELALLPLVESLMDPLARSPRNAAGLWQIMPGTADHLGMRRDWWFDARLDLRASTRHALDYLERLQRDFDGDWLLALAAYNAGKARVRRALARSGDPRPDFWTLRLPRETQLYVPRLIALAALIHDAGALSLELPPVANRPAFTAVDTGGQIEMLRAAELARLPLGELRRYNPGHLRWATPPGLGELLLPVAAADTLRSALATLPPEERVTWQHYRIRRGDSLIRIARRFDTRIDLLREVNNLRGNLIRAGDTLMIPDNSAWRRSLALAENTEPRQRRGYTVRRGDSLYHIARRFQVTIDDLVTWNDLDPRRFLQPGQSLTLYLD